MNESTLRDIATRCAQTGVGVVAHLGAEVIVLLNRLAIVELWCSQHPESHAAKHFRDTGVVK